MEYTATAIVKTIPEVLILIIMEDTHGVEHDSYYYHVSNGLNPYYNGRYSWRSVVEVNDQGKRSLNPYYNGRYSWRAISWTQQPVINRLNPYYNGRYSWS